MTFKTYMLNNREVMIKNVQSIREDNGILTFYPQDKQKLSIAVDGCTLINSDRSTIDIRCTVGPMMILR